MTQGNPKVSNMQLFGMTPCRLRIDFAIALLCIFTDFLGDNLLSPAYDTFIGEHGIPGMGFGLATSIITMSFILGRLVSSTVMGPLSDYTGRWNAILACTFLVAIGFLLQALSRDFWSLVGFRFFTGFVGGVRVVVIVYITDWISERMLLTFWMSFIPIVSSVSSFFGPFLGGIITELDPTHPLNPAYAGCALNGLTFVLVLLFMRKSPEDRGLHLCGGVSHEKSVAAARKPSTIAGPLVEWKAVALWYMVGGISSAGSQGWTVFLVTTQKELGLSSLVMGSISGWCGIMIIFGQLVVLPLLFHRLKFSEGAVAVFGFSVSLPIIVLGFVPRLWTTILFGSLLSLGIPLVMTMAFAIVPRLCDPSRKSVVIALLALNLNIFKIGAILATGTLYDVVSWSPYVLMFILVAIGLAASIAIIRVLPAALRRRASSKVLLAATAASSSSKDRDCEKKRQLNHRFGFGNEECQRTALALPHGRATVREIDEILEWLKACVFLTPRMTSACKGDIIPDLVKSLLGRWTTEMLEQHGYTNWYECDEEMAMLMGAGFPILREEPKHSRLMRIQDFYSAATLHRDACEAWGIEGSRDVPEILKKAVQRLSRSPRQEPTLSMRVNFGRWLSRFLVERNYQSWPGWFSDGRVIQTLLRSTFPPLKPRRSAALRSLAVLSAPLMMGDDTSSMTEPGGIRLRVRST